MVLIEMCQLAEDMKARVDFLARKVLQPFGSKTFHGKRSHHTTVEQSAFQHLAIDLTLRRDIAHESAGKGVTGSSRIFYFFDRERRGSKGMRSKAERSFAEENRRTVFTVLHDQGTGAHGNDFLRRAREILLPGQHLRLGV